MPKREPYTCSVCRQVHIGANCWSTDSSDEDIDSGLLQAMRTLIPKEVPVPVEEPRVPHQQSRVQSVSSREPWERGESSSFPEERVHTPITYRQATASLSRQSLENKAPFINVSVPDANAYRQQTSNTDIVHSHTRIDSGTQERRQSNEYHMPSPRNYHFSQISALPQPLRVPYRQVQRQHEDQHGQPRRDGQQRPDIQPRRSDEHRRFMQTGQEYRDTADYPQRHDGRYQPQADRDRGGGAQYQQLQQEWIMPPQSRREQQYHPRNSHDHRNPPSTTFRTSQEAMDDRAARSRQNLQPPRVNNQQATPTFAHPRSPPHVPTIPGHQRIQLHRQDSGETQIGHFIEEGKKQYQADQQARERSNTQQLQRTEQDRLRGDQRAREYDSHRSSGGTIEYAQTRSDRALEEENDNPTTHIGDDFYAAKYQDEGREHSTTPQFPHRNQDGNGRDETQHHRRGSEEIAHAIGHPQRRFQKEEEEETRYEHQESTPHFQRRSAEHRQRGEVHYQPRESDQNPRPPLGDLQMAFMKAKAEEDAYKTARRQRERERNHNSKRHDHGISKRQEQNEPPHQTHHHHHHHPKPPRVHSNTPAHIEKTTAEETASASMAHHQRKHSNSDTMTRRRRREDAPSYISRAKPHPAVDDPRQHQPESTHPPSTQTIHTHTHAHARAMLGEYYNQTLQPNPSNPPNPPNKSTKHPQNTHLPPTPLLPETHFLTPRGRLTAEERREWKRRQTHWECALNRLEGRIGDGDGDLELDMGRAGWMGGLS